MNDMSSSSAKSRIMCPILGFEQEGASEFPTKKNGVFTSPLVMTNENHILLQLHIQLNQSQKRHQHEQETLHQFLHFLKCAFIKKGCGILLQLNVFLTFSHGLGSLQYSTKENLISIYVILKLLWKQEYKVTNHTITEVNNLYLSG